MIDRIWDKGLQPERTALAWQRVALALLGLALVAARLAWPVLETWAIPPTAAVALGAIVLYSAAHRRYRGHHTELSAGRHHTLPDGRLVLVTALAAGILALLGAAFVIAAAR